MLSILQSNTHTARDRTCGMLAKVKRAVQGAQLSTLSTPGAVRPHSSLARQPYA